MQQHFNSSTFKEESLIYDKEGITYDEIVFIDNEDVIALVGNKGGILHGLDEEIKVPRGSSKGFYNKLIKKFTGNKQHARLGKYLTKRKERAMHSRIWKSTCSLTFLLCHYILDCNYCYS